MTKLFGEALANQIRKTIEQNKAAIVNRIERINAGLTDLDDCFLSDKLEHGKIKECEMQLAILSGDGCEEREIVIDENGDEVGTRWVQTRYGNRIVGRGVFANSVKALCKKTGWTITRRRVPVWTKFETYTSGMAGVYSGYYKTVRWHTNMKTGEYVGYPE